jgi:hypothetical protein
MTNRSCRHRLRVAAALAALPALFAVALWMPIPGVGNAGLEQVIATVQTRLPGWSVVQATDTWEGDYAVVASCGGQEIGFQYVPGHGLPPNFAWLQPNNEFSRTRLIEISDYAGVLVWRPQPLANRTLSCQEELAQTSQGPQSARALAPIE